MDKDAVIAILRYDIALQNDLIEDSNTPVDTDVSSKIILKQNKLREDMQRMEKEFNRLKFDFNNYLSDVLQ